MNFRRLNLRKEKMLMIEGHWEFGIGSEMERFEEKQTQERD